MLKQPETKTYRIQDTPFFKLRSRKRLAKILLSTEKVISELAANEDLYLRRWKHKKEEKWLKQPPDPNEEFNYRPIDIPDPRLKSIQARIADLLARVTPPDFLFSPVKGRSYVNNAVRHKASQAFWQLDVENYFPSCTANTIARFFSRELMCSPDVVAILTRLTSHNECLPQGSPCSPILAYYANGPMWREIFDLTENYGCLLSVYADDITISGKTVPKELIWKIKMCVHKHGHKLKKDKEVSLIHKPADITGVIVRDGRTLLPNRQLKKLAELRAERRDAQSTRKKKKLDVRISGRLAQRLQVEGN